MNRNIKSSLVVKFREGNHRNSSAPIKRQAERQSRHSAHQTLRTGDWQEEDQFVGEAPEVAFSPDIVGESLPQNPGGFGFNIGALIGGAK